MNQLLALIKARAIELIGETAYQDPAGGTRIPSVYLGAVPPKRSTGEQGQDFPFVLIRPKGGSDSRQERRYTIRLLIGVYADEGEAGVLAVHDLAGKLLAIQRRRSFKPYRLDLPVDWRSGDGEDFAQPQPYYLVAIDLAFKGEPMADIT